MSEQGVHSATDEPLCCEYEAEAGTEDIQAEPLHLILQAMKETGFLQFGYSSDIYVSMLNSSILAVRRNRWKVASGKVEEVG